MNKIIIKKNLDFEKKICDYLLLKIKHKNPNKFAIIFDIDDTLIYTNKKNNQQIKKVYDLASKHHIPIFIITARILNKENIKYSLNELKNKGFSNFNNLFLMPIDYWHKNSIGLYKFHIRQRISKNKEIILNVGDQWTDLFPYPTSIQSIKNDYYIFLDTNEGILVKLKSLV